MFRPDDPLAPPRPAFKEVWHAQVLALADTMVRAGHFTADTWASTLGAALAEAEANGAPDTEETYYICALGALENLTASHAGIAGGELAERKKAWEEAYRRTPHGKPVNL